MDEWPKITTKWGLAVFVIAWLGIAWWLSVSHFPFYPGEMFLMMILGVGMLAPAWLAGALVSALQEAPSMRFDVRGKDKDPD